MDKYGVTAWFAAQLLTGLGVEGALPVLLLLLPALPSVSSRARRRGTTSANEGRSCGSSAQQSLQAWQVGEGSQAGRTEVGVWQAQLQMGGQEIGANAQAKAAGSTTDQATRPLSR